MAVMTTVLKVFNDSSNTRTFTTPAHTAGLPRICLQKRKVPVGAQVMLEDAFTVFYATKDALNVVMPQRISFGAVVRRPLGYTAADLTSAQALFREFVAADEFANMVANQDYAK